MDEKETITIICDNEACREKYILSMDTLRAASSVIITCKKCCEIQNISIKEKGEIEIYHVQ
jgi:hypothetical protein